LQNNKQAVNSIQLYPNPSSDILNISFKANVASEVSFEIIDVLGKQVFADNFTAQARNNLHTVSINNLKTGLYFIKVQNEKAQTIERFIKN
jgi:extracellular elastinolytic metalloproteinase